MLRTDLDTICNECGEWISEGTPCDVCDCCGGVSCIGCSDYLDLDEDGSVLVLIRPDDALTFRRATSRQPRREWRSDAEYGRRPTSPRP